MQRLGIGTLALLVVIALAGCTGLLGSEADRETGADTETLTPAPVPEVTPDATPDQTPSPTARAASDTGFETIGNYSSFEPTCTRPPELVLHVQVLALATNDPETNDGIETIWRFVAPSNKQYAGPYSSFERLIERNYRPLLEAEAITYDSLEVTNTLVQQRVTVETTNRTTTYLWQLEKQSSGRYEGCWMTSGVLELETKAGYGMGGSQETVAKN
jgi:hypothetical protein